MFVKTKDSKLFQAIEAGPWIGLAPVAVNEVKTDPVHRWRGRKISIDLWQDITAFFEWSYSETKSETVVHLFYHPEEGWDALVLPQRGYTGMTIKLIDDHENRIPTYQRLGAGWDLMGTVHHHCQGSAFMSSVDRADEKGKEGLHITVGYVGKEKYDLDCRASFRGEIMAVRLTDWFQLPSDAPDWIPDEVLSTCLEAVLKKPKSDSAFPEWWKENVIKEVPTASYQAAGMGFRGGSNDSVGKHLGNATGGTAVVGAATTSGSGSTIITDIEEVKRNWFEYGVEQLLIANKLTLEDLHKTLEVVGEDSCYADFLVVCRQVGINPQDGFGLVEDMLVEWGVQDSTAIPTVEDQVKVLAAYDDSEFYQ